MDTATREISKYVKEKGINIANMSRALNIPYISLYDSLSNENRDRDLRADEIECRVQSCKKNGLILLLYKDARVDMNILDETVGSTNWQNRFYEHKGILFCSLGINANYKNPDAPDPYEENLTYEFSEFDENGKLIKKYQRPYNTLKRKSIYHKNPLSAIVTVDELGNIDIKGMESEYIDGIKPNRNIDGVKPYIPNRKAKIKVDF